MNLLELIGEYSFRWYIGQHARWANGQTTVKYVPSHYLNNDMTLEEKVYSVSTEGKIVRVGFKPKTVKFQFVAFQFNGYSTIYWIAQNQEANAIRFTII